MLIKCAKFSNFLLPEILDMSYYTMLCTFFCLQETSLSRKIFTERHVLLDPLYFWFLMLLFNAGYATTLKVHTR